MTVNMADSKYTIFLDVQYEGMKVFLQDAGWKVETITGVYGSLPEDRHDDNVMSYAEKNENSVIVTQDKQLSERLRHKGHNVIELGMSELAGRVNEILKEDF